MRKRARCSTAGEMDVLDTAKRRKHTHDRIRTAWETECKRRGVTVPHDPAHKCTHKCRFFRVNGGGDPTFVCEASSTVHVCGDKCTTRIVIPGIDTTACRLTSLCLGIATAVPTESAEEYVQRIWREEGQRRNIVVGLAQPSHRCTPRCRFYTVLPCASTQYDTYLVCEQYSTLHRCGNSCTEKVQLRVGDGYVCGLTGVCVENIELSKDHGVYFEERPPNIFHVSKGTRTKSQPRGFGGQKIYEKIRNRLVSVFMSKERVEMYHRQMTRLYTQLDKGFKKYRKVLDPVAADQYIDSVLAEYGDNLNPPLRNIRAKFFDVLATDFHAYFRRLCDISTKTRHPIACNTTVADKFTACMCHWMRYGYDTIIPKVRFFTLHVPPKKQLGNLNHMSCATISSFTRQFRRVCMTDSNKRRRGTQFVFSERAYHEIQMMEAWILRTNLYMAQQEDYTPEEEHVGTF